MCFGKKNYYYNYNYAKCSLCSSKIFPATDKEKECHQVLHAAWSVPDLLSQTYRGTFDFFHQHLALKK